MGELFRLQRRVATQSIRKIQSPRPRKSYGRLRNLNRITPSRRSRSPTLSGRTGNGARPLCSQPNGFYRLQVFEGLTMVRKHLLQGQLVRRSPKRVEAVFSANQGRCNRRARSCKAEAMPWKANAMLWKANAMRRKGNAMPLKGSSRSCKPHAKPYKEASGSWKGRARS
jgi:hypothetical protein